MYAHEMRGENVPKKTKIMYNKSSNKTKQTKNNKSGRCIVVLDTIKKQTKEWRGKEPNK